MQKHFLDSAVTDTRNSVIQEARDTIHRSVNAAMELVREAIPAENQQQTTSRVETIRHLSTQVQELKLKLEALQEPPTQMGQFKTFFLYNPLQLLSEEKAWDSQVVSVGGSKGYRAGIRVLVAGGSHARGRSISIFFRLFPGPYDDWLQWPFPGKSVTFAMFRRNGNPSHVRSCEIELGRNRTRRPTEECPITCAVEHYFIPIEILLDDDNLLLQRNDPTGKRDVLMVGFALEGEEEFCPQFINSSGKKNRTDRRLQRGHNQEHDPFLDDDQYFCC